MNTSQLSDKFATALVYATRLHSQQRRKISGVPYISHLLSVCALVLEAGGTETEAIAALLHDAIEDQGGSQTREEIREIFGNQVVEIIDGCTECDTYPKPPWQERKRKYITNLRQASASVRLVSLADKLHNARSLLLDSRHKGSEIWQEFQTGKQGTLWFYRELLQVYQGHGVLTEEFARSLAELEKI
ncbi:HD domain-containing protein [Calothrix sp. 336/3]|uniref:HD domain-containing protein n=1 Tax=Calothrix sp. 336/3 TaxID=1337936 RepID=UPI0004E432B3|nr:HD domain-containing protein [Calothrix sp. 336/3]AKG20732.1 phosphohydrolase [Calothrix sp. 336/3]